MFSKNKEDSPVAETKQGDGLLKPAPASTQVNTAGKVGKSHHQFFKVSSEHKPVKQIRGITEEELFQHRTMESAWLSLNGVVYDVTVYINYHPGGNILLDGCGKQCIGLFNQYHPWVNATYLLENYRIGYLTK